MRGFAAAVLFCLTACAHHPNYVFPRTPEGKAAQAACDKEHETCASDHPILHAFGLACEPEWYTCYKKSPGTREGVESSNRDEYERRMKARRDQATESK